MTTKHKKQDSNNEVFETHPIIAATILLLTTIPIFTLLLAINSTPLFKALKFTILFTLVVASLPVFALTPHILIKTSYLVKYTINKLITNFP